MAGDARVRPTDSAWDALLALDEFAGQLSDSGYIEISAKHLKKVTGLEPRILAKMDFSSQRPRSFEELGLNILPIENGKYRLGSFNIFRKVQSNDAEPKFVTSPFTFESVSRSTSSEGIALRKAEISTMIDQFCEEHVVHTFSGRERSPKFQFLVRNYDNSISKIDVDGVQIEVDGGFEGEKFIYIFEVKNIAANDFNIRQLYFPFRSYMAKCSKKIRCIYLVHSRDVFTFYEYEFKNPQDMSSINLVKSQSYYIKNPVVGLNAAIKQGNLVNWQPNEKVPFPQADSLPLLTEMLKYVSDSGKTNSELESQFSLSSRQLQAGSSYYSNAAKYLCLGESIKAGNEVKLRATDEFINAVAMGEGEVTKLLIERVLQVPGVGQIMNYWIQSKLVPDIDTVISTLEETAKFRTLSNSTKKRRAQTLRAWCIWVIQHTDSD